MGANEKHAATYHGVRHDPDLNLVRTVYAGASPVPSYEDREAAFDRMIAKVRAEAKAEALQEVATKLEDASVSPIWCWDKCGDPKCRDDIRVGAATEIQKWLRDWASKYK